MAEKTAPPLTKIRLTADAGGEVPLTAFSATFRMHDIPTAHLKVAVGSPANPGGPSVSADGSIGAAVRTPVKVTAELEGYEKEGVQWDMDGATIFEGVLNRPAYSRGFGAAGLVYIADHWLAGLASGTKLASVLMARGISDLFVRRIPPRALSRRDGYPKLEKAEAELWKNGIKPMLEFTAKLGLGTGGESDLQGVQTGEAGGDIIATLAKMDGDIDAGGLAFKVPDFGRNLVAKLGEMVMDPGNGLTAWDTIITLGNQFGFKVIPNVESATCAPVHPLSGEPYVKIHADEYFDSSVGSPPMTREYPISAVRLYGSDSIAQLRTGNSNTKAPNVLGAFASGVVGGQVLLLPAPQILMAGRLNLLPRDEKKKVTPIFQNGLSANSEALDPPVGEGVEHMNVTDAGNAFAQLMYVEHVFGTSSMRITGRLRFDIAPGSLVEVELVGGSSLFGVVQSVTISIDAEGPSAFTALEIGSVHSELDRDKVPSSSPLYDSAWRGTYLVKG